MWTVILYLLRFWAKKQVIYVNVCGFHAEGCWRIDNYKTAPGCPRSRCLDQYATLITMSFLWTISLPPSKMQTLLCQVLENYLKTQPIDLKEENARCLSMKDINARAHKEIKLTVGGFYTEKLKSPGTGSTEGIYNVYVHSWFHRVRRWQLPL